VAIEMLTVNKTTTKQSAPTVAYFGKHKHRILVLSSFQARRAMSFIGT